MLAVSCAEKINAHAPKKLLRASFVHISKRGVNSHPPAFQWYSTGSSTGCGPTNRSQMSDLALVNVLLFPDWCCLPDLVDLTADM